MKNYQNSFVSYGKIGLIDRVVRVIWGLGALFLALHFSLVGEAFFPYIKLLAAAVVLTGIIGWDPLNALVRITLERLRLTRTDNAVLHGV